MKLLFLKKHVGTIVDAGHDGPEVWATFQPVNVPLELVEMWKFMADEDNWDLDPPVPSEYLDDASWSIEDDRGAIRPICLPAVYDDGVIGWRWRD